MDLNGCFMNDIQFQQQEIEVSWCSCFRVGFMRSQTRSPLPKAVPMFFPMYTVPADGLLKMTKIEPHEDLKA